MGFRINKRIRIAKGVSLNIGKKGISTSVKIGNTTINSRGRVSTRIAPGISYTTNLRPKKIARNNTRSLNKHSAVATQSVQHIKEKKRSTSILLCCLGFLGLSGIHKFYEGKILMGIIYLLTGGLFLIGTIIDVLILLSKPSTYYV